MTYDGPPRDHEHVAPDDEGFDERPPLQENIKSKSSWLRIFYMIVVLILYGVSRVVLGAVLVFQICYVLFTGTPHKPLLEFGQSLAIYTYQLVMYLTFNSDIRPFPLDADWPHARPDEPGQEPASKAAPTDSD